MATLLPFGQLEPLWCHQEMEKANEAAGGHNRWWRRPVHNSHLKSELSSPPVQGPFLVAMVKSRTLHIHENLAYFYWLQSLYLEKQLALGPQIFQMLDSLNHLSFTTQALPQMNLLFVWYSCSPQIQPNPEEELTRLHVTLYWFLTIALYAVICTHYNDISMRRGSCQWEVMFV